MTFGEALDQMRRCRVVARRSNPRETTLAIRGLNTKRELIYTVRAGTPDGARWVDVWLPWHGDLLSNDWEIVESYRPTKE